MKVLGWNELILPSSRHYSLCCLCRILPISWWNPLKEGAVKLIKLLIMGGEGVGRDTEEEKILCRNAKS